MTDSDDSSRRIPLLESNSNRYTSFFQDLNSFSACPKFRLPWTNEKLNVINQSPVVPDQQSSSSLNSDQRLREAKLTTRNARLAWVAIHVAFISLVFVLDTSIKLSIQSNAFWYPCAYGVVILLTIFQYLYTSGSSPGHVQDIDNIMANEAGLNITEVKRPRHVAPTSYPVPTPDGESTIKHSIAALKDLESNSTASVPDIKGNENNVENGRPNLQPADPTTSVKSKSDEKSRPPPCCNCLGNPRPPQIARALMGTSIGFEGNRRCPYCRVWQVVRTKHCHDCDRCVLRFDHHCFWVGTCVGQQNHCRFWWYLFCESALACWTLQVFFSSISWHGPFLTWLEHNLLFFICSLLLLGLFLFLVILLFFHTYLAATNQTTYELTRRKRINYFRNVPVTVHPFSTTLWKNLALFCCTAGNVFTIYHMPSSEELNAMADKSWLEFCSCL